MLLIDWSGTSDLQLERINVYYNEATGGKYVPRVSSTYLYSVMQSDGDSFGGDVVLVSFNKASPDYGNILDPKKRRIFSDYY